MENMIEVTCPHCNNLFTIRARIEGEIRVVVDALPPEEKYPQLYMEYCRRIGASVRLFNSVMRGVYNYSNNFKIGETWLSPSEWIAEVRKNNRRALSIRNFGRGTLAELLEKAK